MSVTTENYLKKIFAASEGSGGELVGLGELAQALSVTPGTVTTMMKSLADAGLVEYRPRAGVSLTESGRREALDVVRRHRLVELFLVEVLGLDWADVHEEAEVLEHAISERLLARIDEILGHPTTDPHGDPIPDTHGRLPTSTGEPLAAVAPPASFCVVRVEHEESGFLDFLKRTGLVPGAQARVVARDDDAGTVEIDLSGRRSTLGLPAAQKILVRTETAGAMAAESRRARR